MSKIKQLDTNLNICYWCGLKVNKDEGAREHLVPRTILQDATIDISNLIISKENAHKKCNQYLANNFEHDFCQMVFFFGLDDKKAAKHNQSKITNLENKKIYVANQFKRMEKRNGNTVYHPTNEENNSFNKVIEKIVKGLFFKIFNDYLDLKSVYTLTIDREVQNIERVRVVKDKVVAFLKLINDIEFSGNDIFKYRYKKVEDGKSMIWELLLYNRFPIHCYLVHKDDEYAFE